MDSQKQFTGFLSSVQAPGELSLSVASITKAILSAAALYAAVKGLDTAVVTSQVQYVIDISVTGLAAGMTVYHTIMTLYGISRKILHMLFAKPVVTIPTAVPTAITESGAPVV